MGALIQTRGTQRLIRHYNEKFSDKNTGFKSTRNQIIADPPLTALFDTPTTGTARPILAIIRHASGLFLPPNDPQNHANLLRRWDYYLANELDPANQEKMRGFLSAALNLNSGTNGQPGQNMNGDYYVAIQFDCIEADANQPKNVLQSDEYKLKGTGHNDDTGLLRNTAYSLIVLVTDPTNNPVDRRDPDNIQ